MGPLDVECNQSIKFDLVINGKNMR